MSREESRLGFGTEGIKSAERVEISDTRLNSIEGVNVQSLAKMDINNNRHLAKFKSTEDIESSCKKFEDNSAALAIAPDCKGKVANANDDTSSGDESSSDDDKSAASPLSMSMSAVISLAAVAGVMLSL